MPQGHQKSPRLFLHFHRLWGWWTKLPGKWSARICLIWLCRISGVVHLRTYSLLVFCSVFFFQVYGPHFYFLLWYCEAVRVHCPHYFHVLQLCIFLIHVCHSSLSPCFFMPFLAVIWVNVISPSSFCMSCIQYFFFSPVLVVNWVSYIFPPNFIPRR